MAVLRQQLSFVKQLFLSGMVDATEAEEMTDPIEIRVRKLERRGAVWSPPLLFDVRMPPNPYANPDHDPYSTLPLFILASAVTYIRHEKP